MTANDLLQFVVFFGVVLVLVKPLGAHMGSRHREPEIVRFAHIDNQCNDPS